VCNSILERKLMFSALNGTIEGLQSRRHLSYPSHSVSCAVQYFDDDKIAVID
jgi:hypothetical protein